MNLIVGSKQPTPVYLSPAEAIEHCRRGASVWRFASTDGHDDAGQPDVVVVGIGVETTFEVLKAVELLELLAPTLHVRMVNVTDLMVLSAESTHPHALSATAFLELFPAEIPVVFNYHGYAPELQGLLFGRAGTLRMLVHGYCEGGTITTSFDMMLRNGVSRFDVAARALRVAADREVAAASQNLSQGV